MYINTVRNIYPYTEKDFRKDNRRTSFPKVITNTLYAKFGVYPVTDGTQPDFDKTTQKVVADDMPTQNDSGDWVLGYSVVDLTPQEIDDQNGLVAEANRVKRTALLSDTDFYGLSDQAMSDAMTTYRQKLRDITSHENWPHLSDDDWPVKP
jgi:hypothetical protein